MTSPAPGHLAAFTAVGGGSALVLLFLMNLVYLDWFDAGGGIVAIWGGIILLLSALLAITIFGLSTLILWRLAAFTGTKNARTCHRHHFGCRHPHSFRQPHRTGWHPLVGFAHPYGTNRHN